MRIAILEPRLLRSAHASTRPRFLSRSFSHVGRKNSTPRRSICCVHKKGPSPANCSNPMSARTRLKLISTRIALMFLQTRAMNCHDRNPVRSNQLTPQPNRKRTHRRLRIRSRRRSARPKSKRSLRRRPGGSRSRRALRQADSSDGSSCLTMH